MADPITTKNYSVDCIVSHPKGTVVGVAKYLKPRRVGDDVIDDAIASHRNAGDESAAARIEANRRSIMNRAFDNGGLVDSVRAELKELKK